MMFAQLLQSELLRIWESGNHPSHNPPKYYVDWVQSKGYVVPWLDWAEENGLIPSTETPRGDSTGKPINPRTRNNYLRLIMLLAMHGIPGFDPRKPYEAAKAMKEITEINLDEKTLAGYIREAYELQSKERIE
ncbi:protein of unknown function [Georgfuchsia toluolica]|uniref:Uncharacterized protein n=2 Tax=Georgfuchsia toluolica TaxID=424218 RepID=A0A916J5W0_9PROT|nr:protein of unknown function [Georgfuchsia toluolica]